MCTSNKTKINPPAAALTLLLTLLMLLACLHLGQADALNAAADIELPSVRPLLSVNNAASDFEQLIEAKLNESTSRTTQTQELLSRKRRYLVFPEGSSFQMVFDEVICVVDYTNYLVLGITVALAWELPSQPPSEAFQDLLNKLDDGTIDISRNDTVSNITYVDDFVKPTLQTNGNNNYKPNYIKLSSGGGGGGDNIYNSYYSSSPVFRTPMHPSHRYADSFYRQHSVPARRKDSHYYYTSPVSSIRDPFIKWSQPLSQAQNSRYPYWALSSHLRNTQRQRIKNFGTANSLHQRKRVYKPAPHIPVITVGSMQKSKLPRHHKIYPMYGKRSIPDALDPHHRQRRSGIDSEHDHNMSRMEGMQIKYHRNSRQTLYERIEKYLNKRGQNGHQCVLRTLCETGQKSKEQEPGGFVGELLRAIFTLPEALDNEPVANRDTPYDKAHAHQGDCAAQYSECKLSIWDAPFIK